VTGYRIICYSPAYLHTYAVLFKLDFFCWLAHANFRVCLYDPSLAHPYVVPLVYSQLFYRRIYDSRLYSSSARLTIQGSMCVHDITIVRALLHHETGSGAFAEITMRIRAAGLVIRDQTA
jgi:hypothetical protein